MSTTATPTRRTFGTFATWQETTPTFRRYYRRSFRGVQEGLGWGGWRAHDYAVIAAESDLALDRMMDDAYGG